MDENDKIRNQAGDPDKKNCECDGNCCPPKKHNKSKIIIFTVILLAAIGVVAFKVVNKPVPAAANESCCPPNFRQDTTPRKMQPAIRPKGQRVALNKCSMDTWMTQVLSNEQASFMILIAVLVMGILSVFTCACNFAIIGVVAGYSGASQESSKSSLVIWKGLSFLLGTILAMSIVGALFGFAGNLISASLGNYWKIAAGLIAIVFGLYSMDLVPFKVPSVKLTNSKANKNIFSAVLFGIAVGGLSAACNTCCNPFFPVILAASFVKGSAIWGFMMLLFFALGFGIPLTAMILGIGMGLGKISGFLTSGVRIFKYIGGIALVLFGFYLLFTI